MHNWESKVYAVIAAVLAILWAITAYKIGWGFVTTVLGIGWGFCFGLSIGLYEEIPYHLWRRR